MRSARSTRARSAGGRIGIEGDVVPTVRSATAPGVFRGVSMHRANPVAGDERPVPVKDYEVDAPGARRTRRVTPPVPAM